MAQIAIPNKEVRFIYDKIIAGWYSKAVSLESYNNFIQSLVEGNMDKFKMYITSYIMQSGSYFDFNSNTSEQIFHVFILGLVVWLRDRYRGGPKKLDRKERINSDIKQIKISE
jgi:hypothetical protein